MRKSFRLLQHLAEVRKSLVPPRKRLSDEQAEIQPHEAKQFLRHNTDLRDSPSSPPQPTLCAINQSQGYCAFVQLFVYVAQVEVNALLIFILEIQLGALVISMAEAAAIVGLVASIASLVDISTKVVSRLIDFTSKSLDIPESFRSLCIRLPLLTITLQHIRSQADAGRLPNDVTKPLKAVIDSTSEQVSTVQIYLAKVLPSDGVSKLERALKALKSLAKEDKIQQALEKIHQNNDLLVLYQTIRHIDTGNRILEELSKLSVAPPASSKSFGVCLGRAPQIEADAFIGRTSELQQLHDWLPPKSYPDRQRIVSIVETGGMGKTQLSLAHMRDCADDYLSVFWMNAKDESSLRKSMADLNGIIFPEYAGPAAPSVDDEKLKIDRVRRWLSEALNDQWLLIFDNYDDPRLPGMDSSTEYDIRAYFPHRAQGSILITTRSPQLLFTKQVPLKKLVDIEQSLAILADRSGRKVDGGKTILSNSKE